MKLPVETKPKPRCRPVFIKLVPAFILAGAIILAGGTDLFSEGVHQWIGGSFNEFFLSLKPYIAGVLIAMLAIYIAGVAYGPLMNWVDGRLKESGMSERNAEVAINLLKFSYWAVMVLAVLSLISTEVLGKMTMALGVFGAFAGKGVIDDWICGLLLLFGNRIKKGSKVQVVGKEISGVITNIGYLETTIQSSSGVIYLRNSDLWNNALNAHSSSN